MGKAVIRDSDPGFKNFRKTINQGPNSVDIGVFSEQGGDLVTYASANEFGTEDGHIPERSFLRATVEERKALFRRFIDKRKAEAMKGPAYRRKVLSELGQLAEGEIVAKIRRGPFTPNKPATIARKGSSRPLIDLSRLVDSIISKVNE